MRACRRSPACRHGRPHRRKRRPLSDRLTISASAIGALSCGRVDRGAIRLRMQDDAVRKATSPRPPWGAGSRTRRFRWSRTFPAAAHRSAVRPCGPAPAASAPSPIPFAAMGGNAMPDSTSARRCTGVVTSTRGAGTAASAAATSAGKNGRPACTPTSPSSGITTDSSMPYMCCGGTVATTWNRSPTTACSIVRLPALLA